jgi:hypothetical protein
MIQIAFLVFAILCVLRAISRFRRAARLRREGKARVAQYTTTGAYLLIGAAAIFVIFALVVIPLAWNTAVARH